MVNSIVGLSLIALHRERAWKAYGSYTKQRFEAINLYRIPFDADINAMLFCLFGITAIETKTVPPYPSDFQPEASSRRGKRPVLLRRRRLRQ